MINADAREKAIRDQQWILNSVDRAYQKGQREGEIEGEIRGKVEGEIKLIRTLQGILQTPVSEEQHLRAMTLEQLEAVTTALQEKLRNRPSK